MSQTHFMNKQNATDVLTAYANRIKSLQLQYSTMPTYTDFSLGDIIQYVGTTTSSYTNGYFYKRVADGWEAIPVQDGGGHEIENAAGTALTQRDTMKFDGYLKATDDSTNEKTLISDAPTEVTWAVWQTMTDQQKAGTKWLITDAPDGPATQVQSDWAQNDTTAVDYIKNKPTETIDTGKSRSVLEYSTWSAKTWNGLSSFYATDIWTDGTNIYYSSGSNHYVLDKSTSTWSTKTWNGLSNFNSRDIWCLDDKIIYSSGSSFLLRKTKVSCRL